jgi:predicted nucleic acid-binding protein
VQFVPVVIDASAVVALLTGDPSAGHVRSALTDEDTFAPELIDVEVTNAFRRLEARGLVASAAAERSVKLALALPIERTRHRSLVLGAWSLRRNLSLYDAIYVSLANRLDCALLTGDRRLATTPGLGVPVILLPT